MQPIDLDDQSDDNFVDDDDKFSNMRANDYLLRIKVLVHDIE